MTDCKAYVLLVYHYYTSCIQFPLCIHVRSGLFRDLTFVYNQMIVAHMIQQTHIRIIIYDILVVCTMNSIMCYDTLHSPNLLTLYFLYYIHLRLIGAMDVYTVVGHKT